MKVRFNANACGFSFGYPEGAEADLSKADAENAIKYGYAVAVPEKEKVADKSAEKPDKKKSYK